MKYVLLSLFLSLTFLPTFVSARTTATFGQQAVGTSCGRLEHSFDFDTLVQCTSSAASGGTKQTAPIILGTVTAPPYAATTCDANKAGMIQWTGTSFTGCDGTSWVSLGGGGCNAADAFSFTNQSGVDPSATITSNAVSLTGGSSFTCAVGLSCTGCTEILVNGVSLGGTRGMAVKGDTVAMSLTSSATATATATASLTAGATTSSVWSVTTTQCPNIGDLCADGSRYAGITPDGGVRMYAWASDAGFGARWSTAATVLLNRTSTITGESNTTYFAGLSNADSPYTASVNCNNSTLHSQSDWYLPAQAEFAILAANYAALGMVNTQSYWTSTENSTTQAVSQRPGNAAGNTSKTTQLIYRCIRK